MAQADSTPTAVRDLFTGASSKASTRRRTGDRRYFIGGSDARIIMGDDETALLRLWREKRGDVEPRDLSNGRWYGVDTGQVPFGPNIGALFYATPVFLLGCLPRNIILILLRFLNRNKRLRFGALDKVSSNQLVQSRPQERLK